MAGKRKAPAKKELDLVWRDGFWYLTDGKTEENVGRSRRYAENILADRQQAK